ncbi:AraC family transcriptional regulator [Breoghania sp. JC706]|uniref:AraC family transcriptional regulator n=1 Tax=Breoghania sp. JC706 TaxID=3117732 RepID=UPI00300A0D19
MDPLSDVLSLLRPRSVLSAAMNAGADWAIRFPPQGCAIKTGAIVSGTCWLVVDGEEPILLKRNDFFLLPHGHAFLMASDLELPPLAAADVFAAVRFGGVVRIGEGGSFLCHSNRFVMEGPDAALLTMLLPSVVLIRADDGGASLGWLVARMMTELSQQRAGSALVIKHLAQMMLVEALRLQAATGPAGGTGWLYALADRSLGAALAALHADPARRWTVADLAAEAGMSRAAFSEHFRKGTGLAPMAYLTRWRMSLACERLLHPDSPIAAIAIDIGYESESAFSTAFKREVGCPPRQWARRAMAKDGAGGRAAAE